MVDLWRLLPAGCCHAVGVVSSVVHPEAARYLTQYRNMFLAAGPYFQRRFQSNDWLLSNFQSAELTVSTVANLGTVVQIGRAHV